MPSSYSLADAIRHQTIQTCVYDGKVIILEMMRYSILGGVDKFGFLGRETNTSEQFAASLKDKSVVLRLTAGSQEAGFLASFCPITKFPVVVVIKYVQIPGVVPEYLIPYSVGVERCASISCRRLRRMIFGSA